MSSKGANEIAYLYLHLKAMLGHRQHPRIDMAELSAMIEDVIKKTWLHLSPYHPVKLFANVEKRFGLLEQTCRGVRLNRVLWDLAGHIVKTGLGGREQQLKHRGMVVAVY